MKALICLSRFKSVVRVEFDRDIPSFPGHVNPLIFFRNQTLLCSRGDFIPDVAQAMAEFNAGNLPIEFSKSPIEVYRKFLEQVLYLDGFIGIRRSERYYIEIEVGRLFDPVAVANQVATIVRDVFYAGESIELKSDQDSNKKDVIPRRNQIIIS